MNIVQYLQSGGIYQIQGIKVSLLKTDNPTKRNIVPSRIMAPYKAGSTQSLCIEVYVHGGLILKGKDALAARRQKEIVVPHFNASGERSKRMCKSLTFNAYYDGFSCSSKSFRVAVETVMRSAVKESKLSHSFSNLTHVNWKPIDNSMEM